MTLGLDENGHLALVEQAREDAELAFAAMEIDIERVLLR